MIGGGLICVPVYVPEWYRCMTEGDGERLREILFRDQYEEEREAAPWIDLGGES